MIFHLNDKDGTGINYVPSTYKIISLDKINVKHPNVTNLSIGNITDKDELKKFLKDNKSVNVMILRYLLVSTHSQSIVFYQSKKSTNKNLAKLLAKYYAKKTKTEPFEFTNDVNSKMIKQSKITKEVRDKILSKIIKFTGEKE